MAAIAFSEVGKVYPDGTRAVTDLSLDIDDGELVVFVGPSGCGKTTALRMAAGLEEITEGELRIGDQVVNNIEPRKRDVAMVFQNYALYPHMTIFDNIAFPLRARRVSRAETRERVRRVARLLGLEDMLGRRPRTLSGGQRQRVAMGRAIVREPQVFLMDEPLSNLDAKLRVQMRGEITKLQRELNVTTIYVTHDQVEAMTMGTRIAVMRRGVLQQYAPPQEVYDRPENLFVATFIGSPAMNLFKARLEIEGDAVTCLVGQGQALRIPFRRTADGPALASYSGRDVGVGIRPEHLTQSGGDHASLKGEVALVEALGFERLVHIEIAAEPVLTEEVVEIARDVDAAAVQSLREEAREHRVSVVARLESDVSVEPGQPIEIGMRPTGVHFFDLETGAAIR